MKKLADGIDDTPLLPQIEKIKYYKNVGNINKQKRCLNEICNNIDTFSVISLINNCTLKILSCITPYFKIEHG